jgi:O-antigen/teichoic acid export membrane protein
LTEEKVNSSAQSTLSKRLVQNSLHTGLALAFVGVIPFAFNFLIARTFGKETLGMINVSISFCLMITIFVTNFFGTSGTKFLAEYRGSKKLEHFKIVLKLVFIGPLILTSVISIILIINWEYFSYNFSLSSNFLFVLILFLYLRSYYIIFRRVLYGVDLVRTYAINEALSAIIMLVALLFVCLTEKKEFLIHCYLISYAFFFLLSFISFSKKFKSITSKLVSSEKINSMKVIKSFANYGLVSMLGTVASTSTSYISLIIIGIHLSHSDAGIYSSVLTIVSILMFFPKLFTQVFLPEFSKLFGEGDNKKIFQIFNKTNSVMILLSALICLLVFIFSHNILSIFGKEFSEGSLILRILIPSLFIRMISIPFVSFLSGTKYVLYPNIGGIIILIISSLCWVLLVPDYNLVGIAIGYTAGIVIGIGYQIFMAIFKIKSFRANY